MDVDVDVMRPADSRTVTRTDFHRQGGKGREWNGENGWDGPIRISETAETSRGID